MIYFYKTKIFNIHLKSFSKKTKWKKCILISGILQQNNNYRYKNISLRNKNI